MNNITIPIVLLLILMPAAASSSDAKEMSNIASAVGIIFCASQAVRYMIMATGNRTAYTIPGVLWAMLTVLAVAIQIGCN